MEFKLTKDEKDKTEKKRKKEKPPKEPKQSKQKEKSPKTKEDRERGKLTLSSKSNKLKAAAFPNKSEFPKPIVAIDVGSKTVKVVAGQYKKGKISVTHVCEQLVSEGKSEDGQLLKLDATAASITNLMYVNNIKLPNAVCTTQNNDIIQRELTVPPINPKEVDNMISYEMVQYLPAGIDNFALQHKVLADAGNDQGHVTIQVCGVPKSTVKDYLEILSKCQLKPLAMDVDTNALSKLLKADSALTGRWKGNIVLIDMGFSHFHTSFFSGGECRFNHISDIGCRDIDEIIRKNVDLSPMEVEAMKVEKLSKVSILELYRAYKNVTSDSSAHLDAGEVILRDLVKVIDTWIETIRGVLQYYIDRDGKSIVDCIYLYGGGAFLKDIDRCMDEVLAVPAQKFPALEALEVGPGIAGEDIGKYLNAIGALIRI